jgi:cyclopropane fatty-acyl-phospholipid synthase-like methyltransferase
VSGASEAPGYYLSRFQRSKSHFENANKIRQGKNEMIKLKIPLLFLSIFLLGAQQAQQRRDPQEYIKRLETEQRVKGLQIDRVVEALKISPGQKVADLGSGSGLFTRPISSKVGEKGTVFAIDIDPELLKHIEKTAGNSNIRTVLAGEDDPKIPERVDLIIIIDTLHHIRNREDYLKKLRDYLQPSGRIAIIDFNKEWPPDHAQMKYTPEELEGWMKAAGFNRVEKHDFLNNNFFVIYAVDKK